MPQLGSATIMLSTGQLEVLRAFASSRDFPVSVQSVVHTLLIRKRTEFEVTPEVERALGLIDLLSGNREFALTVSDDAWELVNDESKALSEIAWMSYQNGRGKRKKLPIFYRHGFFLLTLLGSDYLLECAMSHPKFANYLKTKPAHNDSALICDASHREKSVNPSAEEKKMVPPIVEGGLP